MGGSMHMMVIVRAMAKNRFPLHSKDRPRCIRQWTQRSKVLSVCVPFLEAPKADPHKMMDFLISISSLFLNC